MKNLWIGTDVNTGADVSLPLQFLQLRTVHLGSSGAGKTAVGRLLFEEAVAAGVVAGAIDLKGDWWGLKASADGKTPGLKVIVFGGDHQDVPLDERGGAALAEIIADIRQPFIVDLEQLPRQKQETFLANFFERLYDINREPLVLFCDEVDRYAPQNPMSGGPAIASLAATEDLAKRGRKHGIFPKFITQRNASLNKNVAELCDVAIVHRTSGPNDQKAVRSWFEAKATADELKTAMALLTSLNTGTAIVCSAHPSVRMFEVINFRMPRTFDSSATPEIGKTIRQPKEMAAVDLELVRSRMTATLERMKANDPKELQRQLAELRKSETALRRQLEAGTAVAKTVLPDRAVLDEAARQAVANILENLSELVPIVGRVTNGVVGARNHLEFAEKEIRDFHKVIEKIRTEATKSPIGPRTALIRAQQHGGASPPAAGVFMLNEQHETHITKRQARVERSEKRQANERDGGEAGGGDITPQAQKFLNVIATMGKPLTVTQMALLAGYSPISGGTAKALAVLRREQLITGGARAIDLTEAGHARARAGNLPKGVELLDYWIAHNALTPQAGEFLRVIYEAYPNAVHVKDVAEKCGYSSVSGGTAKALALLRKLELIEGASSELKASGVFFE